MTDEEYEIKRARGIELSKTLKVGDVVTIDAQFTWVCRGIVEQVQDFGFKVVGLSFGWHELVSIDE